MFFAGGFLCPPACATGTSNNEFWRGAALNCRCPRTHCRLNVYFTLTSLHDGPVHRGGTPKSQKPTPQLAVQFEFRFFPRFPRKQRALQGLRTASCEWVFWGFGLQCKRPPPVEALIAISPRVDRDARGQGNDNPVKTTPRKATHTSMVGHGKVRFPVLPFPF